MTCHHHRSGSLFSGVGGLDLAVTQVFSTRPAWFCDNDPAATRVLAHRFPGVPNLGDITTINWADVPPVDVLTGGFPCQDLSAAGRQAGLMPGTRSGLWSHMATAIRVLRPRLVVIENVRNLLNAKAHHPAHRHLEPCPRCMGNRPDRPVLRALGAVLGDLADLGYDAVWHGLPASAQGAPHERFRVFILAVDTTTDPAGPVADAAAHAPGNGRHQGWPEPARQQRGPDAALCGGATAADTDDIGPTRRWNTRDGRPGPAHGGERTIAHTAGPGRPESDPANGPDRHPADDPGTTQPGRRGLAAAHAPGPRQQGTRPQPTRSGPERSTGPATAHTDRVGRRADQHNLPAREPDTVGSGGHTLDWGVYTTAIRRWEHLLGRPAPTPRITGPRGGLKLNPALCEWMQGFPAGWFTDVPGVGINDALRLAGNSVNPPQAIAALRWCLAHLTCTDTTTSEGTVAA